MNADTKKKIAEIRARANSPAGWLFKNDVECLLSALFASEAKVAELTAKLKRAERIEAAARRAADMHRSDVTTIAKEKTFDELESALAARGEGEEG